MIKKAIRSYVPLTTQSTSTFSTDLYLDTLAHSESSFVFLLIFRQILSVVLNTHKKKSRRRMRIEGREEMREGRKQCRQ